MRRTRRGVLAAAGSVVAAGCTGNVIEGPGDSAGSVADSASVLLNWKPNGLHAPYYAAVDQGFYEEQGFEDVTIESGQGSDFSAQQAGLGNVEFGITSGGQLLNVNTRGLSPRCVSVVMQRGQVVAFTVREQFGEELTDAAQLEGATFGSSPGSVRLMTRNFFEHEGVLDSIDYVDTGFDTVQQLLAGEVDAAGGVFSEIVDAESQGYTVDAIPVHGTIPSYGHVIAADEGFATENPETVRAFLRATARGAVWATNNPGAAIDALIDAQPELEEVREIQRQKWELMYTGYTLSDAVREQGWGWSEPEPWESAYETLATGDFLEGTLDPETVWTNEYVDADHEYVGDYAALVEE